MDEKTFWESDFFKENWFKLFVAFALILIGISVFYYFVVFMPRKERARIEAENTKIEQQKQEQLAKEQKEKEEKEETQRNLNSCLDDADSSYNNLWFRECEGKGLLSAECKKFVGISSSIEYYEKYPTEKSDNIFDDITKYYEKRDKCSCLLPKYNADRAEEINQSDKAECFKKYPQK